MINIDSHKLSRMRTARESLVKTIRGKGIKDERVLEAVRFLPRELFISNSLLHRAYEDTALPIEDNQTISQPYTVAYMTELLQVNEGDKILEIGTGSGYQSTLLYLLGANVYSVERIRSLYDNCKAMFAELGVKANLRIGDGSLGWSEKAPFDSIIITAAAPEIPTKLILQLKIGGRMVVPVGDKRYQDMYLVTRFDEEQYNSEKLDSFKFVPLIGRNGWTE